MQSGCGLDAAWMQSGCCPNHFNLFKSVSGHLSMVLNIQSYKCTGWMGWRLSRLLRLLRAPNGANNNNTTTTKLLISTAAAAITIQSTGKAVGRLYCRC